MPGLITFQFLHCILSRIFRYIEKSPTRSVCVHLKLVETWRAITEQYQINTRRAILSHVQGNENNLLCTLYKGFASKFSEGYLSSLDDDWSLHWPKDCDNNSKDEDNSTHLNNEERLVHSKKAIKKVDTA